MYSVELNPAHNQKKGKKKSISSVLSITRSRYYTRWAQGSITTVGYSKRNLL